MALATRIVLAVCESEIVMLPEISLEAIDVGQRTMEASDMA